MKARNLILAGFLLLPLFPANVDAAFTDVRGYEWWLLQSNTDGGAIASTAVTIPADPHAYAIGSTQGIWEISATYQSVEPAAGVSTVTYQFNVNGTAISGCVWSVRRSAAEIVPIPLAPPVGGVVLTTELISDHNFLIRCLATPASITPGAHTLSITATGTNPVTNARTDIVLKLQDAITDATLDAAVTSINNQALVNRQNVNSNTNTTVTNALNALQAFINAHTNGTYNRWDSSMNRLHLQTRASPTPSRGQDTKGGYGYFYPGTDTGTTLDATDHALFVPWNPALEMSGNFSTTFNIIPENVVVGTGSETPPDPPFLAVYRVNEPNTYWGFRLLHSDASSSPCEPSGDDLWTLQYRHGSTVITGTECYPYYEPTSPIVERDYGIAAQRDTFNKTVTWSINGVQEGPFNYVTQPASGEAGFLVIGACGPDTVQVNVPAAGNCGDVANDDFRGNITEVRIWNHAELDMENLTAIADPTDPYLQFCAEGSELALYYLEPYFVPQGTQCATAGAGNQTFNVDRTLEREIGILGMASLPGFTESDTTAFIVLLIAMIWAMYNGKWFAAFGAFIGLLMTIADTLRGFDTGLWFAAGILLFILGLWLNSAIGGFKARRVHDEGG